jgi:hypothetical protein
MSAAPYFPKIVKLTISPGGSLPSANIYTSDSVFWFNDTTVDHQPIYQNIKWGVPPSPLPPQRSSSQVVFGSNGTFVYKCSLHPNELPGTITVTDPPS